MVREVLEIGHKFESTNKPYLFNNLYLHTYTLHCIYVYCIPKNWWTAAGTNRNSPITESGELIWQKFLSEFSWACSSSATAVVRSDFHPHRLYSLTINPIHDLETVIKQTPLSANPSKRHVINRYWLKRPLSMRLDNTVQSRKSHGILLSIEMSWCLQRRLSFPALLFFCLLECSRIYTTWHIYLHCMPSYCQNLSLSLYVYMFICIPHSFTQGMFTQQQLY